MYIIITLCVIAFLAGLALGAVARNRSNMVSEIVRVVYYIGLSVWFWAQPEARPWFVGAFVVGVFALDLQEALTSAILGVGESFRNEGTSLRERRIRLWLNVFYLGKPVKGVRLGMDYGGAGPVIVSVDFIDDRTAPGGHVSDRLPALLTALAIRSHIMTMLRF